MNDSDLESYLIPFEGAALIVIDFQEKLLPAIKDREQILNEAKKAIIIADVFGIPVIISEQVPEKIGQTVQEIKQIANPAEVITKKSFSCFGEQSFVDALEKFEIDTLIICGIESHVCVLQTVLDALSMDYEVYILKDAVGSRKDLDKETALERASLLGAEIVTVEMMAFEWLGSADNADFKVISNIVK